MFHMKILPRLQVAAREILTIYKGEKRKYDHEGDEAGADCPERLWSLSLEVSQICLEKAQSNLI